MLKILLKLEPMVGIEPTTYSLPWNCSAAELHRQHIFKLSVGREGFGFDSRLAVARLGLTTVSRFRLLAKHRSGVQTPPQLSKLY